MGKSKETKPEPEKTVRISGENLSIAVSEAEKKYRNRNGPDDVKDLSKDKIKCTVCAKSLADVLKKVVEPYVHMVLGVLMCKDCACFYGDGYFSADEDGDDKYCRWCGQGGTLYLCSTCTCAFCKKCIKQNLGKQAVQDLESDDWQCLICKPKPLFECRTVCWAVQEFVKTKKEELKDSGEPTSRPKREKAQKSTEVTESRKRKADETDDVSEGDQGKKRPKSSLSKKSRRNSSKEDEKSNNDTPKSGSRRNERKSSHQEESTPTKKSPRLSKMEYKSKNETPEEILISEDDDEDDIKVIDEIKTPNENVKSSGKRSAPSKQSKTQSQEREEKRDKSKRVQSEKIIKDTKNDVTPSKRPSRSQDKKLSEKKTSLNDTDLKNVTSRKRSQQKSKGGQKSKIENDNNRVSEYDSDQSGESESKTKFSRRRSEANTTPIKSKLALGKNADSKVVQASKYINSALKDVSELSVLISSRCEKLCSKSIQSNDDVLSVYNKLQQLLSGVHANLDLIERGLNTKISGWKGSIKAKDDDDDEVAKGSTKEDDDEVAKGSDNLLVSSEEKPKENLLSSSDEESTNNVNPPETKKETDDLSANEDEEKMEVDSDSQETVSLKATINEIKDVLYTKSECEEDESIIDGAKHTDEDKSLLEKMSSTNKNIQETSAEENELVLPEDKREPDQNNKNDDEASITEKSTDPIVEDSHQIVENSPEEEEGESTKCNSEENQSSKIDDNKNDLETTTSVDENKCEDSVIENENLGSTKAEIEEKQSSNDSDSMVNDIVESGLKQSSALKIGDSKNNDKSDLNFVNNGDASDTVCNKQKEKDICHNDKPSTEIDSGLDLIEERSGAESIKEDVTTPAVQTEEIKDSNNGSSNSEKRIEEESKTLVSEQKSSEKSEKKEDSRIPNTTNNDHKSSSHVQESHSSDHNHRHSGDRHYSQDNSRRSGGSRDWDRDRDRYRNDRWSGPQRSSWNRYDDRRPGRGGWGWNH